MAARRGRAEQECVSESPHAWGAAGGAGGGRRAAREGGAAGGPSPCPALGRRLKRREFPRPGGRCGCRPGSLQVTRGAAPAGPSGAEHAAGRAELGAEWTQGPRSAAPEASPAGPGPAAGLLEELAPGPRLRPGSRGRGLHAPQCQQRAGHKGLGAVGARSPCPRPAFRLLRPSTGCRGHPACSGGAGGTGRLRHLASGTRASPRVAACWPRRRRGLSAAWPCAQG